MAAPGALPAWIWKAVAAAPVAAGVQLNVTVEPDTTAPKAVGVDGAEAGGGGTAAPGYTAVTAARSSGCSGRPMVRLVQPDAIDGAITAPLAAEWPKPMA